MKSENLDTRAKELLEELLDEQYENGDESMLHILKQALQKMAKEQRHLIAEALSVKSDEIRDDANPTTIYMSEAYKDAHNIAMNTRAV